MKNLILILGIILVSALLYLATIKGVYGNVSASSIKNNLDQPTKPLELSPERGRFLLTQNLSLHNSFALSQSQADAAMPDVGYYKGRFYIFFAPGISLYALPFYNLGQMFNLDQLFTFGSMALLSIANLVFIYLIGRDVLKLSSGASLLASLIFAVASTSLSYATTLYEHPATVFFLLSSFYFAWQYKHHPKLGWIFGLLIWINYGLSVLVDYPNGILLLPIMVYFLINSLNIKNETTKYKLALRPTILITAIIFVVIMTGHGYYNYVNFGSWNHLSGSLVGYKTIQQQHLDRGNLDQNIAALSSKKNPVNYIRETNIITGLYELLFAVDKGIFIFSPIFIISVLGILLSLKKKFLTLEIAVLISIPLVNLLFYASWSDPWGGWAFGPRYLIPAMSVLSLFVAFWADKIHKFAFLNRLAIFLLFCVSSAIALLGALTTNAVPPKVEATYLHIKYGFMYNLDFLKQGKSGSFIYNYFLHQSVNLLTYYLIILIPLILIASILLFIIPRFERRLAN